jgi:hypothetical protein
MITTKSSSSIGSRRLDSWTRTSILRQPCTVVAAFLLLSGAMAAGSQPLPGTLEVHWNEC